MGEKGSGESEGVEEKGSGGEGGGSGGVEGGNECEEGGGRGSGGRRDSFHSPHTAYIPLICCLNEQALCGTDPVRHEGLTLGQHLPKEGSLPMLLEEITPQLPCGLLQLTLVNLYLSGHLR